MDGRTIGSTSSTRQHRRQAPVAAWEGRDNDEFATPGGPRRCLGGMVAKAAGGASRRSFGDQRCSATWAAWQNEELAALKHPPGLRRVVRRRGTPTSTCTRAPTSKGHPVVRDLAGGDGVLVRAGKVLYAGVPLRRLALPGMRERPGAPLPRQRPRAVALHLPPGGSSSRVLPPPAPYGSASSRYPLEGGLLGGVLAAERGGAAPGRRPGQGRRRGKPGDMRPGRTACAQARRRRPRHWLCLLLPTGG